MVMLVTLDEVKRRLQFNHDADDNDLMLIIEGASAAVLNYLKVPHTAYDDSSGEVPVDLNGTDVPAEVKNAVIMLTGILKRDPSGVNMAEWERGYLPAPVLALLYPLRDPAMS
ncbi:MAG: head-tail connector protein [Gammaproteobacteria bacterium]